MKNDEDVETPLLADGEPAPANTKAGNTYALVCALLASLTSIIYGYSKHLHGSTYEQASFLLPSADLSPAPPQIAA